MGLSTKQVSSNGVDWTRTLLQAQSSEVPKSPTLRRQLVQNQHPPEKCPRCDSMNTKFCYYNNYNKSQPRHFCKTCKRHWTKGGTLRNVPVGGGRKNKRPQTVNSNVANIGSSTSVKSCITSGGLIGNRLNSDDHMAMQSQQQCQNPSLLHGNDKTIFETQYHMLQSSTNCSSIRGTSLGSISSFSNNHHPFFSLPSSSGSFESSLFPVSTSNQSSTADAFPAEESEIMKESTFTTFMPISSCSVVTQLCELPSMSHSDMDMTSFLTWEEIDNLVTSDLNTWNDAEMMRSQYQTRP